jgi:hypothetical protein
MIDDGVRLVVSECEWMAGCRRVPAHVVAHAVLGQVLTCADCVRRFDLDDVVLGDLIEVEA